MLGIGEWHGYPENGEAGGHAGNRKRGYRGDPCARNVGCESRVGPRPEIAQPLTGHRTTRRPDQSPIACGSTPMLQVTAD